MKYIIGIESTAHTFGVAVLEYRGKGEEKWTRILSNVKDSYITKEGEGGMIPMEVRKHHEKIKKEVYEKALKEAGIDEKDIIAVTFSNAPGLAPCLIVGKDFAKEMAKKLNVPVVPVNHCIAHLEIGDLCENENGNIPQDPVLLYASGANTQIIAYESGKYRIFGETLDLGVGNFIDTIARFMGLGFPGGPKIQKLAESCNNKKELIEFPYSVKGMDVSFSGIQTKIRNYIQNKKYTNKEISYSLQEHVFAMLVEAAERALAHTGKEELLLGGGVGCNSRLQEMCRTMCKERGVKFFCPPKELLLDNPAMIGYLGMKMFNFGLGVHPEKDKEKFKDVDISPRERTDDVDVGWRC